MPNETLQWINEKFHSNLTNDDLNSVNDFLLLWSIFEKQACNNQGNIDCILRFVENNYERMDYDVINPIFHYFSNRYIQNGQITHRFQYLRLPNDRLHDFVSGTLMSQESTNLDKLKACLLIVFRFRNNLFHGEKNILTINNQIDNFSNSNELIKHLIERIMAST